MAPGGSHWHGSAACSLTLLSIPTACVRRVGGKGGEQRLLECPLPVLSSFISVESLKWGWGWPGTQQHQGCRHCSASSKEVVPYPMDTSRDGNSYHLPPWAACATASPLFLKKKMFPNIESELSPLVVTCNRWPARE